MTITINKKVPTERNYPEELAMLVLLLQSVKIASENVATGEIKYNPVFAGLEENIIRNKIFEIIGRL